jgi:hypothetical protein
MNGGREPMQNTVTQFETRWNRLIVELFGLGSDDDAERDEDSDERRDA